MVVLGLPSGSQAQIIQLDPPRIGMATVAYGTWLQRPTGGVQRGQLRQTADLFLQGSLFGVSGLRFSASATPFVGQGVATGLPLGSSLRSEGLNAQARLSWRVSPEVSLSMAASGSNDVVPSFTGGFTSSDARRSRFELSDANPLLPISLTFQREKDARTLSSAGNPTPIYWERQSQQLAYRAHNWKTQISLRQVDGEEFVDGERRDFRWRDGRVSNRQRWGKGSSILNAVDVSQRSYGDEVLSAGLSSSVSLLHTRSVSTTLYVRRDWGRSGDVGFSKRRASATVQHTGTAIRSRLIVREEAEAWGDGARSARLITSTLRWSRQVNPALRLSASLRGEYRRDVADRGQALFFHVVDERHLVGTEGRFRLEHPFVDITSVTLEDPETGTLFVEGLDFGLLHEGPYVAVFTVPGGRLTEGETAIASYRYEVPAHVQADAARFGATVSVRWRGLDVFIQRDVREQLGSSGDVVGTAVLGDSEAQIVGAALQTRVGGMALAANGQQEWFSGADFDAQRRSFSGAASAGDPRATRVGVSGRWIVQSSNTGDLSIVSAESRLSRPVLNFLVGEVDAGVHRVSKDGPGDRFVRYGVSLSYERAKSLARLSLHRLDSSGPVASNHVSLEFKRRF
jgi:hypothetical protein